MNQGGERLAKSEKIERGVDQRRRGPKDRSNYVPRGPAGGTRSRSVRLPLRAGARTQTPSVRERDGYPSVRKKLPSVWERGKQEKRGQSPSGYPSEQERGPQGEQSRP